MSTSSYVQDTTIDEAHNTQRVVVRRVRSKMCALTLCLAYDNSVANQIRTTLESVARSGASTRGHSKSYGLVTTVPIDSHAFYFSDFYFILF